MFDFAISFSKEEFQSAKMVAIADMDKRSMPTNVRYTPDAVAKITEAPSTPLAVPCGEQEKIIGGMVFSIHIQPNKWTEQLEKSFTKLIMKKGSGKFTEADAKLFKQIKEDRRRLLSPRSADDIAEDYERWQATEDLLKALDRYVKVIRPPK